MAVSDSFLAGRLLVAMPGIGDPRFERSVVFLCAHDAQHAMGLAVNRPVTGLIVGNVLTRLKIAEKTSTIELPQDLVLMGGPVERDRGFVLHTDDYMCPTSSQRGDAGPRADRDAGGAGGDRRPQHAARAARCWRWATPAGTPASWSARSSATPG